MDTHREQQHNIYRDTPSALHGLASVGCDRTGRLLLFPYFDAQLSTAVYRSTQRDAGCLHNPRQRTHSNTTFTHAERGIGGLRARVLLCDNGSTYIPESGEGTTEEFTLQKTMCKGKEKRDHSSMTKLKRKPSPTRLVIEIKKQTTPTKSIATNKQVNR